MDKTVFWNRDELLNSPLFAPLHEVLLQLERDHFPGLRDLNALLQNGQPIAMQSGQHLSFVAQGSGKLPFEMRYEQRCYLRGEVQTRTNNLHDLFNALVWLVFPRSKAALNARHFRVLTEAAELPTQRGKVRDMATLFDESGVVVACAEQPLAQLLRDFEWKELLWTRRSEVGASMGFYLFGHALYEKSMQPYIGMTGHGLLLPVQQEFFSWTIPRRMQYLDQAMADYFNTSSNCCDTRELTPVPLLGIPGWAVENQQAAYYDNSDYFRPQRRAGK